MGLHDSSTDGGTNWPAQYGTWASLVPRTGTWAYRSRSVYYFGQCLGLGVLTWVMPGLG